MGQLRTWLRQLFGGSTHPDDRPAHWARMQEILAHAIAVPPEEREIFLERIGDPRVAHEVKALLAAHEAVGAVDRLAGAPDVGDASGIRPGLAAGQYEIQEQLGVGGMGAVYRALDTKLGRAVALKFLPRHLGFDGSSKQRFLLEAQAAASLDHSNVCTIHEIGETSQGRMFISMPCYDGETIKRCLERGPLPLADALEVALQAARGLARAHQNGIVHRDIKPANLMRTRDGTIKILDFGLAKVADVHLTSGGLIMGTAPYMSPEQAAGDPIDHRTDLWSLGVVLHEMVTGRRPFDGEHVEGILAAILTEDPPAAARDVGVGMIINRIVASLLAKPLTDRCASAGELIPLLEEAIAMERGDPDAPALDTATPSDAHDSLPPEGERRQATVIVSRLTDYSTLLEAADADELEAALARFWETAHEIVGRHGGVVNRFGDEELVCLFGLPAVHEDDYVRATRAAFELHARLPSGRIGAAGASVAFDMRTGISSGVLVVQRPTGTHRRYKIAGEPIEMATHLAVHAAPGHILVGPESNRLVAPYFETETADAIPALDRGERLRPFRIVRAAEPATRLEASARTGLTMFCGREVEATSLVQSLQRAADGVGQFVTIVGDAGVGKSRLLYEFARSQRANDTQILRGRCHAGGTLPYQPFVEVLRNLLELGPASDGFPEADDVAMRMLALGPELEDFVPLYLHLLSMDSARFPLPTHFRGEHFRPAMREALSAILAVRAEKQLTVLLLEDWHWADRASHEALHHLIETATQARLLIVTTYRPGHRVTWSDDMPHTSIHLGPLQANDAERMMRSVFDVDELPPEVTEALHERAGGNPFFLEELCFTLREQRLLRVAEGRVSLAGGLHDLHLPATVQGVIRTRLDSLDSDAREIIRLAAVVGRDFARAILDRVLQTPAYLDRSLERLKELGIIQRTRVVPDPAFRFKHALTQEVAYDTLLQHQRRALHGRVGSALEELCSEQTMELAERLADHFSRAEEWSKAVRYGLAAAHKAQALSEFADALAMLERVEEWTLKIRDDTERQGQLIESLLRQERICETLAQRQRQQEILSRLLLLLEPDEGGSLVAEVYRRQGDLYVLRHQFDAARNALERAIAISRKLEDLQAERNAVVSLGLACWHEDRPDDALPYLERALAMDRARGARDAMMTDLMNLGQILRNMGDYDRAEAILQEASDLLEQVDVDIGKRVLLLQITAQLHRFRGDYKQSLEIIDVTQRMVEANHLPIQLCFQLNLRAGTLCQMGRIEEGLELYSQIVEVARKARHAEGAAQATRITGEILDSLGRHDEALVSLSEAADLFVQTEDRGSEALMRSRIAIIHERAGRFDEAERAWSMTRDLYRRLRHRCDEAHALEGLARVLRDGRRDIAGARDLLVQALELVCDVDDPTREAALRNVAGNTAWEAGAYVEALAHFERALDLFRRLDHTQGIGLAMNSLGATLVRLGRREDGRRQLEEAIAYNADAGELLLQGYGLSALGDVLYDGGDFDSAERCFRDSLAIRRTIGDRRGEGWMLERLARLADARGDFDDAIRLRQEARHIADDIGEADLLEACTSSAS